MARGLATTILVSSFFYLSAQNLEHVPPVLAKKATKDNTALLLSTADLGVLKQQQEEHPYASTLQILDADQSWPPRWYYSTPVYTNAMFEEDKRNRQLRVNFIEGPQNDATYLSYASVYCQPETGQNNHIGMEFISYFKMLNGQMALVDSIMHVGRADTMSIRTTVFSGILRPGFKNDPHGEELSVLIKDSVFDLSMISGSPGDKSVEGVFNLVQILDHYNNVILNWTPLQLSAVRAYVKDWLDKRAMGGGSNSLFKIDGVSFDSDGNILYSLEKIGIGKISRTDGHVMWHIDYANGPLINGKDTLSFHSTANFKALMDADTSFVYTILEHGADSFPLVGGIVFEQNKKTLNFKVLKYMNAKKAYRRGDEAQKGTFDYRAKGGSYLIEYGQFEVPDTAKSNFQDAFEYGKGDSTYGAYLSPKWNFTLGAHRLENWPLPARPTISKNGNKLEAQSGSNNYTWYKLSGDNNTSVTEVGHGPVIHPENGATYCVAVPYGIGFSVSRSFTYKP